MGQTFHLALDGVDFEVEVHGNTFVVDGHPFVVGFERGAVTVDGIGYDIQLEGKTVVIDGITHEIRIDGLDHRRPAIPKASPTETTVGAGVVKAIMPGTIVRVFVTEGDSVNTGDVLLVLEAMKMENELQSPTAGVVKVIHVQPGDAVEMDAVLIEVESIVV